jgi:RHS repeat-associated protein
MDNSCTKLARAPKNETAKSRRQQLLQLPQLVERDGWSISGPKLGLMRTPPGGRARSPIPRPHGGLRLRQAQSFTYDAVGNRTNATINAASATYNYPGTSHKLSGLTGATIRSFTYDTAGNVTASAGISFVYDGRGRMKQAGSTTYLVNGLGQRVKKSGGADTFFAYDEAGHLIGEYDGTGAAIEETVWLGDIPVAVLKTNGGGGVTAYYIWSDQLNTPRLITDVANNARWEWANNDPFGNNAANENPSGLGAFSYNLRFPGQYYDAETGLHYNYFRDYDPRLGRYVQSDPLGLRGGMSTYGYVGQSPYTSADSLGLYCSSQGGMTYCSLYPGPTFALPTQRGFPNQLDASSAWHHYYHVKESIRCARPNDVLHALINNPTPDESPNPASALGSPNNARIIPGIDNPVVSYLTKDLVSGEPLVVNITNSNSQFSPGFVARTVSGGYLHTYGEGANFWQSRELTSPLIQDLGNWWVWSRQSKRLIGTCPCSK